jgi:hypothetical protein
MEHRLPAGHLDRPKSGFNLPIMRWMRSRSQVLDAALDRLADANIIRRPRFASFGSEQIWSLLVLDRWLGAQATEIKQARPGPSLQA